MNGRSPELSVAEALAGVAHTAVVGLQNGGLLQRLPGDTTNTVLAKLEGNNPAGSVKDRPALSMIAEAEAAALAEALRSYADAAYPAGGSECAQVARETLRDSAGLIARDAAGPAGAAAALEEAATAGSTPLPVHLEVDTGMGRLGLLPDQAPPFMQQVQRLPHLDVQGIFTHFSVADQADKTYTRQQLSAFEAVLAQLRQAGIDVPIVHAANSAALLTLPDQRTHEVADVE